MGIIYWNKYSAYFFHEKRAFVGGFMDELVEKDSEKAVEIMSLFFDRLENGRGLPDMWFKDGPKLKKVKYKSLSLFEYRNFSDVVNLPVRIYFVPDKKNKVLVFLDAHFKNDDKDQQKHIKIAYNRWRIYSRNK